MAIQEIRTQLVKVFNELGQLQQTNKFFFTCMSEGLMPKGFQMNFNLANYVNDKELVTSMQALMEDSNSRLFDLIYVKNREKEEEIVSSHPEEA